MSHINRIIKGKYSLTDSYTAPYLTLDGCTGGLVLTETLKGSQRAGETGPTVLVVDDEELVRNFLRRVLAGAGYRVISASSGEEAMAILESTAIDLVVTDIRMPGMDGRDLGVLISQLPLPPPVIYASASDNPPAGGYYIQKPFPGPALIRMAQEVISINTSGQTARAGADRRG